MERGKYSRKVTIHGEVVWRLLELNPGGLTMDDLIELSELTRSQIRKAFEYIRDLFAASNDQPIIYVPGRHKNVYKLAVDQVESDYDLIRRVATWRIQIRRARTATAQPAMAKFGESVPLRRLNRHLNAVEEDLADIMAELVGQQSLV